MITFEIGNQAIELEKDFNITLNRATNLDSFTSDGEKSFTFSFKVPNSKKNIEIFGGVVGEIKQKKDFRTKIAAVLKIANFTYKKGTISILGADFKEIEIFFKAESTEYVLLPTKKIGDYPIPKKYYTHAQYLNPIEYPSRPHQGSYMELKWGADTVDFEAYGTFNVTYKTYTFVPKSGMTAEYYTNTTTTVNIGSMSQWLDFLQGEINATVRFERTFNGTYSFLKAYITHKLAVSVYQLRYEIIGYQDFIVNWQTVRINDSYTLNAPEVNAVPFIRPFTGATYPTIDFCFPTYKHINFFGDKVLNTSANSYLANSLINDTYNASSVGSYIDYVSTNLVPMIFLKSMLKTIFDSYTITLSGDFISDTDLHSIVIYNNRNLDDSNPLDNSMDNRNWVYCNNWRTRWITTADHVPSLSTKEFMNKILKFFGMYANYDAKTKVLRLDFVKTIINSAESQPFPFVDSIPVYIEDYDGYTLSMQEPSFDKVNSSSKMFSRYGTNYNEFYYRNYGAYTRKIDGGSETIDLGASTLIGTLKTDVNYAFIDGIGTSEKAELSNQVDGLFLLKFDASRNSVARENFDNNGVALKLGTVGDIASEDTTNIYTEFWKDILDWFKRRKRSIISVSMRPDQFLSLKMNQKYNIDDKLYLIKSIQGNFKQNSTFVNCKIEIYTV